MLIKMPHRVDVAVAISAPIFLADDEFISGQMHER